MDRWICRTILPLIPAVEDTNGAALLARNNNEQSFGHAIFPRRLHPMATRERSCAFFEVVLTVGRVASLTIDPCWIV